MPVRPLYDCTVLLNGSRDNSVFVPGISAVELYVLKAIHGANESGTNPIINVKKTGKGVERSDAQERARIGARYAAPGKAGGIAILNSLYGVGNRLPTEYVEEALVEHSDAPLLREQESIIDLPEPKEETLYPDPGDPITSVPNDTKSKKTAKASVLEN